MLYLLISPQYDFKNNKSYKLLKIGYAKDVEIRLDQYLSYNFNCELLKTREGNLVDEKVLQKYFWKYKFPEKTEYFYYSEELIEEFDKVPLGFDENERKLTNNYEKRSFVSLYLRTHPIFNSTRYYSDSKELSKYILYNNSDKVISYILSKEHGLTLEEIESSKIELSNNFNANEETVQIVDSFLDTYFDREPLFHERMRMYCEFCDNYSSNPEITGYLNYKIQNYQGDYEKYYTFYGTSGCKALEYRDKELSEGMRNNSRGNTIIAELETYFKIGEKYTLKEIKAVLKDIYSRSGITSSPKASDLENYFELQDIKIYDSVLKKQNKGYRIISLKTP